MRHETVSGIAEKLSARIMKAFEGDGWPGQDYVEDMLVEGINSDIGICDSRGRPIGDGDVIRHDWCRYRVVWQPDVLGFVVYDVDDATRSRDGKWLYRVREHVVVVESSHEPVVSR